MPVYEYVCGQGHRFERIVPVSKIEPQPKVKCPYCERKHVDAELVFSRTSKPILKAGIGGFHSPNA